MAIISSLSGGGGRTSPPPPPDYGTFSLSDYYKKKAEAAAAATPPAPTPPAPTYSSVGGLEGLSGAESPLGPGMLDFMNIQLAVAEELYPGQGFMPTADEDYTYMAPQIEASIDPAIAYAEQFGLQNVLGYPQVEGGYDFFGGGGGGGETPAAPAPPPTEGDGYKMFEWDEGGYQLAGGAAPDWWQAFVPKEVTPETAYGAMLNAMIPFLSPEDQVRTAHSLYAMFDTEMSHYKPGYIPEVSTVTEDQARYLAQQGRPVSGVWEGSQQKRLATGETITTRTSETEPLSDQMRRYYMSSQRATDAIQTLSNMREAMVQGNRWKLGPGYKWLQNVMGSVAGRGASGETAQTREQYLSMLSSVDPFLSQAGGGELQAFGPLGQMLTKPFFTAGQLMPQQAGRFGAPNRRMF